MIIKTIHRSGRRFRVTAVESMTFTQSAARENIAALAPLALEAKSRGLHRAHGVIADRIAYWGQFFQPGEVLRIIGGAL
jgi:hypothetical protein